MYERVLIPLDGSEPAETILPFAEKVAGPLDAEIVLLRVVEPISPTAAMAAAGVVPPDAFDLSGLEARRYLAALAVRLGDKGLRVRTAVRFGLAAPEIVRAAVEEGADLIAMSTHGRGGLGRLVFGSVAEAVLRTAPIPVLMFRMEATAAAPAGEGAR